MMKGSTYQEDKTILNVNISNIRASANMKQKLIELKEIDKSTDIVEIAILPS